jgi:hypothetical protein
MYPKIFVENDFFEEFEIALKSLPEENTYLRNPDLRNKHLSKNRVIDLFNSSEISTDITLSEAKKYSHLNTGKPSSLKEAVLHGLLKSSMYSLENRKLNCNKSADEVSGLSNSYFLGFEKNHCEDLASEKGRMYFGKDFFETPFFLNFSRPSELTDDTLYQTMGLKHPCSNLIIIDKYLFEDHTKDKVKITNLIQVIESFIPKNLNQKFEIDILSENKECKNSLIKSRIEKIENHFGDRISLHVYTPMLLKESDRYFITNYMVVAVPHPLDRETTISSNFFLSHETSDGIIAGYKLWSKKIGDAISIIQNCKETVGMAQCVWKEKDSKHSIFEKRI